MNPLFHTEFSISDSLKNVRKSVLIYETIILIDFHTIMTLQDKKKEMYQMKRIKKYINELLAFYEPLFNHGYRA